jgi:hypothetical protein
VLLDAPLLPHVLPTLDVAGSSSTTSVLPSFCHF